MSIGLLYGGSGADVLLTDANSDNIPEFASSVTYTAWTAITGGTQITELYTYPAQGATTTVTPDAIGRVIFYAYAGYTAAIYLRNEAATGATRWLVAPLQDMATRSGVTAHSALTGLTTGDDHTQYLNNTRGDARYLQPATAASTYVALAGNQTVAGVKTFSSAPVLPAAALTIANTNTLQATLDAKVAKSDSIKVLSDVSDVAYADGDVPMFDTGTNQLEPTDISTMFAAADPSTGDILYTSLAPFMGLFFIKNEGDPDPTGLPLGSGLPIIGYQRPAAASIIPIFDDDGVGISANNATVVTTQDYVAGEDLLFAVGLSAEAGSAGSPAEAVFTYGAGAAAQSLVIRGFQSTAAGMAHYHGKCTTHIPPGTTGTITFKGTDGTTTQNRAIGCVQLIKLPNLAASPFDQSAAINAGSSGTLNLTIGPTGATTQPSEVAIMSIYMSGGGPPAIRTITGTSGWTLLKLTEGDAAASSRILATFYKVLSATGGITGNATVGASGVGVFDNQTGGWAGVITSWKS